ncbi:MAG TPA: DNA-processing protein DprA [Steroidobacteraceae bacterium]
MDEATSQRQRRLAAVARAGLSAAHLDSLAALAPALGALERCDTRLFAELGLTTRMAGMLAAPDEHGLDADLRWLESSGAILVAATESEYPPLLRQSPDAPAVLYVLGDISALGDPQIAIVGTRNPTAGGRDTARRFAGWFARAGLAVTSGLALGIDTAAHEGALEAAGRTLAVLGCGLDVCYPRDNRRLFDRVTQAGAVLSEFPPGTEPRASLFPQRNRIIAGLSSGTVVVEAASRSGSLITARLAGNAGRDVFAIPGSIHNEMARGCHELIRQGAKLVERPEDVLSELKISLSGQLLASPSPNPSGAPVLDKEYKILLDALAFEPAGVDTLIERTGLSSESIASMLLVLELDGHVAPHPGGRYSRIAGQCN